MDLPTTRTNTPRKKWAIGAALGLSVLAIVCVFSFTTIKESIVRGTHVTSMVSDASFVTPSAARRRLSATEQGCQCANDNSWGSSCGKHDSDPFEWCYTKAGSNCGNLGASGKYWDKCNDLPSVVTPNKCNCEPEWKFEGVTAYGCDNPDGGPHSWCKTTHDCGVHGVDGSVDWCQTKTQEGCLCKDNGDEATTCGIHGSDPFNWCYVDGSCGTPSSRGGGLHWDKCGVAEDDDTHHPGHITDDDNTGSVVTSQTAENIVASHNHARKAVGTEVLQWNSELAAHAQTWAEHLRDRNGCNMEHSSWSSRDGEGENLYWCASTHGNCGSGTKMTEAWVEEKLDYIYNPLNQGDCRSGKVCGHYTQVVWKSTNLVGCGMASCDDGQWKSEVWVCRYDPGGNYIGQYPY